MSYSSDLSNIRKSILNSIQNADSGHLGPSFSCTEILYIILKKYINFKNKNRNKIILSKGHAAPAASLDAYPRRALSRRVKGEGKGISRLTLESGALRGCTNEHSSHEE